MFVIVISFVVIDPCFNFTFNWFLSTWNSSIAFVGIIPPLVPVDLLSEWDKGVSSGVSSESYALDIDANAGDLLYLVPILGGKRCDGLSGIEITEC